MDITWNSCSLDFDLEINKQSRWNDSKVHVDSMLIWKSMNKADGMIPKKSFKESPLSEQGKQRIAILSKC